MKIQAMALAMAGAAALSAAPSSGPAAVTYYKDVVPVIQNRCQECHRPGEVAPMAFMSYEGARPWAKAIKAAVLTRKMPPWPADPHYGKFLNERRLTETELNALVAWADSGAPAGSAHDAPQPRNWVEGWTIGKPDLVFEMPVPFQVPAQGVVDYNYVVLPTHFTRDMWVQAAEVRPGNRKAVHHVIAFLRPPGSKWLADAKPGVPFVPAGRGEGGFNELLVGYAPGLPAYNLLPGMAKMIPAGADIVLQLHYNPDGKPEADQTKVGLIFSKEPPARREMTLSALNSSFAIPPGDPNYEGDSKFTLARDVELVGLMPHMHLRGKDFEYTAVFPDGRREKLLSVPRYDFNWQLFYYLAHPIQLPAGTRIECKAHWDNSANNPNNPDPAKLVRWGDQSFEEMMIGWFDVAFPAATNPRDLFPNAAAKVKSD